MLNVSFKESENDELKVIKKLLAELEQTDVVIGIPESADRPVPSSAALTMSELLYIQSEGSPINNIPPRPVVEPAILHDKERVAGASQAAIDAALEGNKSGMEAALNDLGQLGADIAKDWFANPANGWALNAPATVKAKGGDKPLIDTGELRNAIGYEVKKRGK